MIEWKDEDGKHSRYYASFVELPSGSLVYVHAQFGFGDALFVTCPTLKLDKVPLGAIDLEAAKVEALQVARATARCMQEELIGDCKVMSDFIERVGRSKKEGKDE